MDLPAIPEEVYLPAQNPTQVLQQAQERAGALMRVVREHKLAVQMKGQQYLRLPAWQLLGAFYGLSAAVVSIEESRDETGRLQSVTAWAEAVWQRTGRVVSRAAGRCDRSERLVRSDGTEYRRWENADDFAIISMAQTRAIARALRHVLGFVPELAGFESTPAEEMPYEPEPVGGAVHRPQRGRPPRAPQTPAQPQQSPQQSQQDSDPVLAEILRLQRDGVVTSEQIRDEIDRRWPGRRYRDLTPDERKELLQALVG